MNALRVKMVDGVYDIPVRAIAQHKAAADKANEITKAEIEQNFEDNPSFAVRHASEMTWAEASKVATRLYDKEEPEAFWTNADKTVVQVNAADFPKFMSAEEKAIVAAKEDAVKKYRAAHHTAKEHGK